MQNSEYMLFIWRNNMLNGIMVLLGMVLVGLVLYHLYLEHGAGAER